MESFQLEKGIIFEVQAPNGVMIKALVVAFMSSTNDTEKWLCYSQNRLFTFIDVTWPAMEDSPEEHKYSFGDTIVDYCIIPEYDSVLNNYEEE